MEASPQYSSKRNDLEEGVMHLKERLEEEEALSRSLRSAFDGSVVSLPSLSSLFLPPQATPLLSIVLNFSEIIQELALVEAEILCLDRKIEELKLKLCYEQRQTQELTEQKRTLARQNHVRRKSLAPLRHDLHQRSFSHHYQRSALDTVSSTHSRLSFSYAPDFLDATSSGGFTDSSGGITRDIGPYKNFIHISRNSIDVTRFTHYCSPAVPRLSVLMDKLSEVDLSFLTYKQKLAFWINIYNACIMHAFLEYGLPSSHNRLLTLMNKASLNVGGIVLNALAIEHFVLRHPCEPEHLRVYSADEVVNDLGRARVEYLEASVGVSSKKKIIVPQLLQWHMKDFADDIESLLEWIYSQLPRSGSLKAMVMECLKRKVKVPLAKMVEIQTYGHEFRYLLSL
ncbi:hypothetical protein Bca4012_081676 [Brassica carinata]